MRWELVRLSPDTQKLTNGILLFIALRSGPRPRFTIASASPSPAPMESPKWPTNGYPTPASPKTTIGLKCETLLAVRVVVPGVLSLAAALRAASQPSPHAT